MEICLLAKINNSLEWKTILSGCLATLSLLAIGQPAAAQTATGTGGVGSGTEAVPSLQNTGVTSGPSAQPTSLSASGRSNFSGKVPKLPTDGGQYWEEYDLTPYTKELSKVDRPHQAIIDWVLRETGTDAWFTDPFGFINADKTTLRVYHNEQMHKIVRGVHERFVNGTMVPQAYGMRLLAIGNPNWRTRALGLMRSVPAQSPGVNAFLISKENSAMLMALLRGRSDFKELSAVDIVVYNGQPQVLEKVRSRNYVREFRRMDSSWPPYIPTTGEIQEGYRLQISPLLDRNNKSVDLVVKCHIDQVEKLVNVNVDLPLPTGQVYPGQISVPQIASWRLHERFRWPADDVLLLSCGVVAAPQSTPGGTLLGQSSNLIGLDRILPNSGGRADAILLIEYRGDATQGITSTANLAQPPSSPISRGRY